MRIKSSSIKGRSLYCALVFVLMSLPGYCPQSIADEALDPGYLPTVTPGVQPTVPNYKIDHIPKFTADFWRGQTLNKVLPGGTVLTGVLQDKLSSKSSQVGDVFAIELTDGYSENGRELLPKSTKIVGCVRSVISGKLSRNAQPGRVEISLQTLVLPDGRSTPIYAFIERNPNLEFKKDPYQPKKNLPFTDYGRSLSSSVYSLGNTVSRRAIGMGLFYPGRTGAEFEMEQGEVLPLRLNRQLDVTALLKQPLPEPYGPQSSQQPVWSTASQRGPAVPGMVDAAPPQAPPYARQLDPASQADVGRQQSVNQPKGYASPSSFNQQPDYSSQPSFNQQPGYGGQAQDISGPQTGRDDFRGSDSGLPPKGMPDPF